MNTFRELLYPFDVEQFFREYWTRKPLIIPGERSKTSDLFSWELYGDLLDRHHSDLTPPRLRMHASEGGFVDLVESLPTVDGGVLSQTSAARLNQYCQEGATLVFDQIHRYVPALRRLSEKVAAELGERVQINSFASWRGASGFPPHYDSHELFIIQIAGEKHWELLGQTFAYPLPEHRSMADEQPTDVALAHTLTAGDVMYMPRGTWHRTLTGERPSLHLTMGVNCRNGIDLLIWVMEELKNNPVLRQNLPIHYHPRFSPGYRAEDMKNVVGELRSALDRLLDADETIDRYNENCLLNDRPHVRFTFPHQISAVTMPDGPATRFYRPLSQRVQIKPLSELAGEEPEQATGVQVLVWGKELIFGGDVEELITRLFEAEHFSGADVLAWDEEFAWEDIEPILEQLLAEQILFVDTA